MSVTTPTLRDFFIRVINFEVFKVIFFVKMDVSWDHPFTIRVWGVCLHCLFSVVICCDVGLFVCLFVCLFV